MPCSHPRAGTLWEMRPSATCTATQRGRATLPGLRTSRPAGLAAATRLSREFFVPAYRLSRRAATVLFRLDQVRRKGLDGLEPACIGVEDRGSPACIQSVRPPGAFVP